MQTRSRPWTRGWVFLIVVTKVFATTLRRRSDSILSTRVASSRSCTGPAAAASSWPWFALVFPLARNMQTVLVLRNGIKAVPWTLGPKWQDVLGKLRLALSLQLQFPMKNKSGRPQPSPASTQLSFRNNTVGEHCLFTPLSTHPQPASSAEGLLCARRCVKCWG